MKEHRNKILSLGVECLVFLFMLSSLLGCASLKSVFQMKPERVDTVLLSDLMFRGVVVGVKVPAIFGDFSITHRFTGVKPFKSLVVLTYMPHKDGKGIIFILLAKPKCPEVVAMNTYDLETKKATFWTYDREDQPWQVDKKRYNAFL